ncbi:hypothetical protein L798_08544 [Zootermopsis nevadensis]|uniref:Uncharacterized protein n=1 Tax=Zootermopsis nevadensis TaxID=136037 RepID=A0A067R348_ZOONE|nr:hypothetical protein L798_08544 [Zootermopsis nevadensis]
MKLLLVVTMFLVYAYTSAILPHCIIPCLPHPCLDLVLPDCLEGQIFLPAQYNCCPRCINVTFEPPVTLP